MLYVYDAAGVRNIPIASVHFRCLQVRDCSLLPYIRPK